MYVYSVFTSNPPKKHLQDLGKPLTISNSIESVKLQNQKRA